MMHKNKNKAKPTRKDSGDARMARMRVRSMKAVADMVREKSLENINVYLVAFNPDTSNRYTKHVIAEHHAGDPLTAASQYKKEHPSRTTGDNWAIYVLDLKRIRFEGTLTPHGWEARPSKQ
jgi:hypothetical protein